MLSKKEILERLRVVMVDLFEMDEALILPSAKLNEDLDLDSIDAIDLALRLESVTGTRLSSDEFSSIHTVNDIVEFVHRLQCSEQRG